MDFSETVLIQYSNGVTSTVTNDKIVSRRPHLMTHHAHNSTGGFHEPPHPVTSSTLCATETSPDHVQQQRHSRHKSVYSDRKKMTLLHYAVVPAQTEEYCRGCITRPTAKEFAALANHTGFIQRFKVKKKDSSKFNFNDHHAPALFIPCVYLQFCKNK